MSEWTLDEIKTQDGTCIFEFSIPHTLFHSDRELIVLIMQSESMKKNEKQNWFDIWDVMNEAQKEKLRDILEREKAKLQEIRSKHRDPFSE